MDALEGASPTWKTLSTERLLTDDAAKLESRIDTLFVWWHAMERLSPGARTVKRLFARLKLPRFDEEFGTTIRFFY
jgi:hypothetical protein